MRFLFNALACLALAGLSLQAQSRGATEQQRFVCTWGADIARTAQAYKLSGVTRYGARQRLQARKFPKSWMRPMALGITEQTYDSQSGLEPDAVKKIYHDGCIEHELARR
jgi:hypothetical protein